MTRIGTVWTDRFTAQPDALGYAEFVAYAEIAGDDDRGFVTS